MEKKVFKVQKEIFKSFLNTNISCYLLKVTSEMGISHIERNFRAKHYLGLRFKNEVPNNFVDNLEKEKIFISARGKKSIRVTPHIWNNKNDIDKLITGLRKVL